MKITLERFDENFGFKALAGNHEMILDTAPEIGGNDQGFIAMLLRLKPNVVMNCLEFSHQLTWLLPLILMRQMLFWSALPL